MNAGFAYLIQDEELYTKNREAIIELLNCTDGIFNASIIEYNNELYIIIDGHTSILRMEDYIDEEFGPRESFAHSLGKLICPLFANNSSTLITKYETLEANSTLFNRDELFWGVIYGSHSNIASQMFNTPIEELQTLSDTIFKATTEKVSISPINFVETLYDMLEEV